MRQSLAVPILFLALLVTIAIAETTARREPTEVASAPLATSPAVPVSSAVAELVAIGPMPEAHATPPADATALPAATSVPTVVPSPTAAEAPKLTATVAATAVAVPTTTSAPLTAKAQPTAPRSVPTAVPTPTPIPARAGAGQVTSRGGAGTHKVGLQVGHWRREEAGPPFNRQSGSSGGGKNEDEVNLGIARATAEILKDVGYVVDVLPTLIPKGYSADLVISVHADGGPSSRRGFFADRPVRSAVAADEARLAKILNEEYARATGIPYVYRGTENSQYYYGYSRVNPRTPMVLIETGFLSNATDRTIIVDRPDLAAAGIARAIRRFVEGA